MFSHKPHHLSKRTWARILEWHAFGKTGASSIAIVQELMLKPFAKTDWHGWEPSDFGDMKRCLDLVDWVPEARSAVGALALRSERWRRINNHWFKLWHSSRPNAASTLEAQWQRLVIEGVEDD